MNKTFRTIAWLCIVLGIMGMIAMFVIFGIGQTIHVEGRSQTRQSVMKSQDIELGEDTSDCFFENEEGDTFIKTDCFTREENKMSSRRFTFRRLRPQGRIFPFGTQRGFSRNTYSSLPFFPVLLFISGPVLTAIGAVILIVNREPRKKDNEVKNKPDKKSKPEGQS
jgi:hypothetical protein